MLTYEDRQRLGIISAYMGADLTEEQMEFASDFRNNIISFSDPGTGKTHTLTAGIAMLQKYYDVPGSSIVCMSFTNAATYEIKSRYDKLCARMSLPNSAVFNTFHSLSRQIMNDAFPLIRVVQDVPIESAIEDMKRYLLECGIDIKDKQFIRKVIKVVQTLNSALMFHPDEIERQYSFQSLCLSIEQFQEIRKKWFMRSILSSEVVQGDLPLYCLYALLTKKDLIPKWKGRFKIMIVDEFQDLSLLHLHILGIISTTLIVIGDMKQQIYAFNGACPQIVDEYLKIHPDAKICNLTNSFRCKQNIADFASKLIEPNNLMTKPFTGVSEGGSVSIMPRRELDWEAIANNIKSSVLTKDITSTKQTMFIYRNNASAIPIIEELYQLGIPFRSSKFARIMDIPIFKEICTLANAAWKPTDEGFVTAALRLFPEFSGLDWSQPIPPVTVIKHTGKSLFDIKYKWKEQSSIDLLIAMQVARKKILEKKSAGIVINNLLDVYERYILKGQWFRLDNPKEYYFNLVGPICNNKEYPVMFEEENDKMNKNIEAIKTRIGVRCYTMHSAKGLEADDVYILDCDEGIFPNAKVLKDKTTNGCLYDAACDIRAERNLLYVAVTRAKENVYITYSGTEPSRLVAHPDNNQYLQYDAVYKEDQVDFDNVEEFCKLFNIQR